LNIVLVAHDDCLASSVIGMFDAFNVASYLAQQAGTPVRLNPLLATADGKPVRAFGGIPLTPSCGLDGAGPDDIVVLPPMVGNIGQILAREQTLLAWLRTRGADSAILSSVCTGAFMLAEAGLLQGRKVTTNPNVAALFHRRYPDIELDIDKRIVDQSRIITAGTTTAFIDLAIYLVESAAGPELAVMTAKALSFDKNGGSQRPSYLAVADKNHDDAQVRLVQEWLEESFRRPLSAEDLALKAGISVRSLSRRFRDATGMPPMEYLRRLRVEAAKRLLEAGQASIDDITALVGYEDTRSFQRLFHLVTGLSPRAYRARFGARQAGR
jgi:transcriptional regulator GlxA family with amidase domain